MSGHSKWHQIKRQKGAQDKKRGALFTKLSKAITLAAKEGGDPETNFKLRLAIEKAKAANMPKENIERAIQRAQGGDKEGNLEEVIYEGYGPGGVAIVIKVLTDNRNRAHAAIKHIMEKYGGSLGTPNSVLWQFNEKGVIRCTPPASQKEEIELWAIELGAEDIQEEESMVIYTPPDKLATIKEGLEKKGVVCEYAEVELIPQNPLVTNEDTKQKLEKLFGELEDCEEVDDYYSNIK